MITFVCWRWTPKHRYRSVFAPQTVYTLESMLKRHYSRPFRFVCCTDRPEETPKVETIPLWNDHAEIQSRIGHSYPSCYRRLKVFAPDAGQIFGDRLVSIDLDTVITGNLEPLFDRPEDFIMWGESDFPHTTPFCGSMWYLKTGTRPQVWTEFKGQESRDLHWSVGCRGSDQGWISYILDYKPRHESPQTFQPEATWGRADGVYSFRKHVQKMGFQKDTRIVFLHGKLDPWSRQVARLSWVKEHYR